MDEKTEAEIAELVAKLRARLELLKPEYRCYVFESVCEDYCQHCGYEVDGVCHCTNDE